MSSLRRIARHLHMDDQPPPAPTPTGGLGTALEQLITAQVEQQVSEQLARHRPPVPMPRIDPATFAREPAKPLLPKPPVEVQLVRNELEQVSTVFVGNTKFNVQRDGRGRVVRLVPEDTAPPSPAVDMKLGAVK